MFFAMWLVDTDWKQEIFKRLDALAEKLGTTATYLWAVLVRQGYVEGVQDVLIGLIWLGLYITALVISSKWRAYGREEDDADHIIGGWVVFGVGHVLLLGVGTYLLNGIVELLNPEYYALVHILNSLK